MSSDEEDLIRGRIVTSYLGAKKSVVAIEARLKEFGSAMVKVGNALSSGAYHHPQLAADLAAVPSMEEVTRLLGELTKSATKKNEAEKALREMGMNITP